MKLSSTRILKRRDPPRLQSDSHLNISVPRRRSSRLQSNQRSVSISRILGSYYESQSHLEQRPTNPQTLQPVGTASDTHVPTSNPIGVSTSIPSRTQFEEYPYPPEIHNKQTRKRKLDTSIKTSAEIPQKRARLTKKNLRTFEKMGGGRRKDSKSKSSQSEPNSSRSKAKSKSSATTESTSKTVSTTDSNFPRLAFENGVLDPVHSTPNENLESLQDQLDRVRDTASPTESEYKNFAYRIQKAPNEATVLLETSKLLKEYGRGYRRVYNQALNSFPKDVGLNDGLSAAQPDMVEGLDMTEFNPFPILAELGGAAVPTIEVDPPTLPHLAGEWKGPGKDMVLAQTQAAYDGACMVYGRNEALSFLNSPDPISHAFVSTFTTDGTTLNTFAHYSSETQGQVKYHQYPTSSSFLISSYEDFKKSRRRLRNLQDDAKEASEKLRDKLNEKWSANHRSPVASSVPAETADSTSYEYDNEEDPSSQLLTEYWTSFSGNNQDDSFVDVPTAHNVYDPPSTSFQENYQEVSSVHDPAADSVYAEDDHFNTSTDDLTFPPITPPQSSKSTSLPLELSEDIDNSNVCANRKTRRTRTQATDPVEGSREVDHDSKLRKIRRNHWS